MRVVGEILLGCGTERAVLPPTALYNEGWLLRLALDALAGVQAAATPLAAMEGARWFSEGLLPSPFLARHRGDRLAEGWTHADAAIGHFRVSTGGGAEVTLQADAQQLVVLEAKLGSPLSKGTTWAPRYNQAARNVACVAEVLWRAKRSPSELESIGFFVLAPSSQVGPVVLPSLLKKESLRAVVEERVHMYEGEREFEAKRSWFEQAFLPLLDAIQVEVVTWEQVLAWIRHTAPEVGSSVAAFYEKCLEFNLQTLGRPQRPSCQGAAVCAPAEEEPEH